MLLKPGGVLFTYGVGAARPATHLGAGASCRAWGVPGDAGGQTGGQLWAWLVRGWGKQGARLWGGPSLSGHVLSPGWGCFGRSPPGREGSCPPSPQPGQGLGGLWRVMGPTGGFGTHVPSRGPCPFSLGSVCGGDSNPGAVGGDWGDTRWLVPAAPALCPGSPTPSMAGSAPRATWILTAA